MALQLGSHVSMSKGLIGAAKEAIWNIVHHTVAQNKPLILETPWLDSKTNLYTEEIAYLRKDSPNE